MAGREKKALTDEEIRFLASLPSERGLWVLIAIGLVLILVSILGLTGVL